MLHIKRDSAYADRIRNYTVILDGNTIGEIADGESKSFDLEPGPHTLRLKIDWARSNDIAFQSDTNESIHFRCISSIAKEKVWLAIFYALLLPHKYILLERID